MTETQNYKNHARYYPLVHFVLMPLFLLNLIWQIVRLYQEPNWDRAEFLLLSLGFVGIIFASRLQALKAQDRVIRLEERLRYREILPAERHRKFVELPTGKVIALRFASDEELPELLEKVSRDELKNSKEIKLAVKNWRGDYMRV